jgi:hypothetical protein
METNLDERSAERRSTTRTAEKPSFRAETAAELRAKAARYRALAETLFDPRVISVVYDCARELEDEAASVEGGDVLVLGRPWFSNDETPPAELRLLTMLIEKRIRRGQKLTKTSQDPAAGSE